MRFISAFCIAVILWAFGLKGNVRLGCGDEVCSIRKSALSAWLRINLMVHGNIRRFHVFRPVNSGIPRLTYAFGTQTVK